MNRFVFIFVCAAVFSSSAMSVANRRIQNPAVRYPMGPHTMPPSYYRSGLVRTSNPIDPTSRLMMTGNIGGGKHFRGVIPYQATSDFAGRLGSSQLDSFYRDTEGMDNIGRYTGMNRPFYSPTRSVTIQRTGIGVLRPSGSRINGKAKTSSDIPYYFDDYPFSQMRMPVERIEPRLMSLPAQFADKDLERLFLYSDENYSQGRRLTVEQRKKHMEKFRSDLEQVRLRSFELRQDLFRPSEPVNLQIEPQHEFDIQKQFEFERIQKPREEQVEEPEEGENYDRFDVYDQMKRQLAGLEKGEVQLPLEEAGVTIAPDQQETLEERAEIERLRREELAKIDMSSAKAQALLGEHKTFASYSKDKFNVSMREGEKFLKEGKYYKAIDSFTMASVYKPRDPLAMAGKSHALFAAGEYMSSALFLARSLTVFPGYARMKIDIVGMVGDRDKLESRIVDVEQWLETHDVAEMKFLLAYIYYQIDRIDKAKEAIDAAYLKMPDLAAVAVLKNAIDDAKSKNRQ